MKNRILIPTLIALMFVSSISFSQIEIESGPVITPEDMVEALIGLGVNYSNVEFSGAPVSRGIFSNGSSTNIGIETGIFLTSGYGYNIPGPNMSSSSTGANGMPGYSLLNDLTSSTTYDAAVLEFDFVPLNDTLQFRFAFGSEEYNEYVNSSFNDVFGFFISGPNPDSGLYVNKNIALIPGTETPIKINSVNNGWAASGMIPTGPCTNCEYYLDNTNGLTIEYDGFTTVISIWALVVPDESYRFIIAVGDAGDGIFDTGVLMEGTSFKSLGPPEFLSFDFLVENNPGLSFEITGEIVGDEVYLEVPPGTNISNLVADFEVRGVRVSVDGITQEPGISPNDYTEPLAYQLEGYAENEWTVHVDIVTGITQQKLQSVVVGPNPSSGNISIDNINGIDVSIFNLLGNVIFEQTAKNNNQSLLINDLPKGIYFVKLDLGGFTNVSKLIIN